MFSRKGTDAYRSVVAKARSVSMRATTPSMTLGSKMPPGFTARVGQLETFFLPEKISGSVSDSAIADAMIQAWRRDGILQIGMTRRQHQLYTDAEAINKRFFARPHAEKRELVDPRSYSGYIASGEEITDGIADYSEIFTVTKDLSLRDKRVAHGWPCHGPTPWADKDMKNVITRYMADMAVSGEKLLRLIEMGLKVPTGSLTKYTRDGWHHLRMLRFPASHRTNGKGKAGRGIGSHTDYGLLVMAGQDEVGGLFVRPPIQGERFANWEKSAAGLKENDAGWVFVPPVQGTMTVFPGDMMQYMTNNYLQSTPHKVGLNTRDRYSFAYFHEPNFKAVVKPLPGYEAGQSPVDGIHYGTHFTNMFLRNYPDRITTQKLHEQGRYAMLNSVELRDELD